MSHYNSFSKTSMKKYANDAPTYIGKKRAEREMSNSKKRSDYEDKYSRNSKYDKKEKYEKPERYDRYYKDSPHQCKYHLIKDYSQNYFHNSSSNYRNRDGYYSKYHYQNTRSPRKDYKKVHQKYSTESEGVRNLSHCEIPSPKEKDCSNGEQRFFNGIIKNVNELVSGTFQGQQTTFSHNFQNQQNININVISPQHLNIPKKNKKAYANNEVKVKERDRDRDRDREIQKVKEKAKEQKEEMNSEKKECPFPKPEPAKEIELFKRDDIHIEKNPYEDFCPLPSFALCALVDRSESSNKTNRQDKGNISLSLQPGYLLAKMRNWKLMSNFISLPLLAEEKFSKIPLEMEEENERKGVTVYGGEFEDKGMESGVMKRIKLRKEANGLMQAIQYSSFEIIKVKKEIFEKEWKINVYDIKSEEIDKAIEENIQEFRSVGKFS